MQWFLVAVGFLALRHSARFEWCAVDNPNHEFVNEKSDENNRPKEPEFSEAELRRRLPKTAKIFDKLNFDQVAKEMIRARSKRKKHLEKALMGILSGVEGLNFDVPPWVKQASRKFLQGLRLGIETNWTPEMDMANALAAMGKVYGFFEGLPGTSKAPRVERKYRKTILSPMLKEVRQFASEAKAAHAAAFFGAREKGLQATEHLKDMSVRTKICMIIALNWQLVERFTSTAQLHVWLLSETNRKGERLIPQNADSRETRRVCESVGLQFQNPWNKPESEI